MPPKGVQVHGQYTNEYQAEVAMRLLVDAEADLPELELTDWLGEESASRWVWRKRKTPTYWNVEHWPRSFLLQSEDVDVSFP